MAEETKDEHKSETDAVGGETDKKETTGKSAEELARIADDQRRRAEKAEADLKAEREANKPKPEPEKKPEESKTNQVPNDPVELAKVVNVLKDLSDKEIEELQAVAKAKNLSLVAAKQDPLFQAWHNKFQEDARKERNKLGGSRGSDQAGDGSQPTFAHGMKRDDHRKLAEELTGAK